MRALGFHHLALQVHDLERSLGFYRDVLGLEELARHTHVDGRLRSIWLAVPGSGFLALEKAEGAVSPRPFRHDAPGLHLLALRIAPESRAQVVAELEAAGHPLVHQTRWTVYVQDPEGNRIGLSHHPHDLPGEACPPEAERQ